MEKRNTEVTKAGFVIWLTPNSLSPEFSYSAVCCCVCYIYHCKCNDFLFSVRMWRQSSWKATWWIFYLRRDKRGKFFCFLIILYEWPSSQLSLFATAINFLQVKSSGLIFLCATPNYKAILRADISGCHRCSMKKIEGSPVLWICEMQAAQHMISMKNLTKYFIVS